MNQIPNIEEVKYDTRLIENEKRLFVIDGIIKKITSEVKEESRHTFLGSTDRKSYTVKIYLQYLAEQCISMIEIAPWGENAKEIIEDATEKAKFDFANKIYQKLYL